MGHKHTQGPWEVLEVGTMLPQGARIEHESYHVGKDDETGRFTLSPNADCPFCAGEFMDTERRFAIMIRPTTGPFSERTIAECTKWSDFPVEMVKANARLIAAAPALLEALERIRKIGSETPAMGRAAKAQEIARSALAQAREEAV